MLLVLDLPCACAYITIKDNSMWGICYRNAVLYRLCLALVFVGICASSARADVVFNDTTFNLANYTQSPLFTNSPGNPIITISTASNKNHNGTGPALDFDYSYPSLNTSQTFTGELNNT